MDQPNVLEKLRTSTVVAVDIETSGFDPWRGDVVRGVSLAMDGWSVYVPVSHPASKNVREDQYASLLTMLSNMDLLVFHNALFDLSFLMRDGLTWHAVHDTMVYAWLQDENQRLALKELAGDTAERDLLKDRMKAHCRHCDGRKSKLVTIAQSLKLYCDPKTRVCADCLNEELTHPGSISPEDIVDSWVPKRGWDELTYEDMKDYATKDAELTWQLFQVQRKFIDVPEDVYDREMKVLALVLEMRNHGLHVDLNQAQIEFDRCEYERQAIADSLPILLTSPKQVGEYLTEVIKLKLPRNDSGKPMTDEDTLLRFKGNEVVDQILEHRSLTKEGQFYAKLLELADVDGYVHPFWRPTGTVSGRFSCSEPNAQQWPRQGAVRSCITPPDGYRYLSFDLSQAEVRVGAYYAQSKFLIDAFNEGRDVYQEVADKMDVDRQTAKTIVLGTQYGAGPKKLRVLLFRAGIDVSPTKARALWEEWRNLVPEIPIVREDAARVAWRRGYVRLIYPGRVRHFGTSEFWKADPKDAFNALCQGGVGEAVKTWMLRVADMGLRIVAQVHDSITVIVRHDIVDEQDAIDRVEQAWIDSNPFPINIPVEVKVG
ncbi:MAG: DNA polymerase [Bacteroidota bacterium]